MSTVGLLIEEIELRALQYDTPEMGPHNQVVFRIDIEGTSYTIKSVAHREMVMLRANRLRKSARSFGSGLTSSAKECARKIPKLKRQSARSSRISQGLLDDGERDNYDNYCRLYEVNFF